MSGTRLELRNITAGYGAAPVVRQVSFAVEPGSLLALLGPSGCGKSTILKVVAGLLSPSSGETLFDEMPMEGVPAEQRSAPMVFQKPLLFPHLSVFGNVAFGLKMKKLPPAEIDTRVNRALELVRMSGYTQRRVTELSGGQEQRVSLARALVLQPKVLLLDEPFSALDELLRAEMRTLVRDLQRELEITTIFVTHDQQEASRLADRIVLLLSGSAEQIGTTRCFFEAPRTAAVARFFGWQTIGGGVYFRPEHAAIVAFHSDSDHVTGVVEEVVDAGTHLAVKVRTDLGSIIELHPPVRSLSGVHKGEKIAIRIPPSARVAFPDR